MMRLCWSKESNGTDYYCGCGATLITRLHALTSFACISKDQDNCEISPHIAMGNEFFFKAFQSQLHRSPCPRLCD